MDVHIKAVTFPNKQDFLPKLIRQKFKSYCQTRIYILAVCPYNVCDVLPGQLNKALDHACWKTQKKAFVTMWNENYQNTRIVNKHMVSWRIMYWNF